MVAEGPPGGCGVVFQVVFPSALPPSFEVVEGFWVIKSVVRVLAIKVAYFVDRRTGAEGDPVGRAIEDRDGLPGAGTDGSEFSVFV